MNILTKIGIFIILSYIAIYLVYHSFYMLILYLALIVIIDVLYEIKNKKVSK